MGIGAISARRRVRQRGRRLAVHQRRERGRFRHLHRERVPVARPDQRGRRVAHDGRIHGTLQRHTHDRVHHDHPPRGCVHVAGDVLRDHPPKVCVCRVEDAARRRVRGPGRHLAVRDRRERLAPGNLKRVTVAGPDPRERRRRVVRLIRIPRARQRHRHARIDHQRPIGGGLRVPRDVQRQDAPEVGVIGVSGIRRIGQRRRRLRVPHVSKGRVPRDLKHKRVAVACPRKRRRRVVAHNAVHRRRQRHRNLRVHHQHPARRCVEIPRNVFRDDAPPVRVGRIPDASGRRVTCPRLRRAVDQRVERRQARNLECKAVRPAAPRKRGCRVRCLVRVPRRRQRNRGARVNHNHPVRGGVRVAGDVQRENAPEIRVLGIAAVRRVRKRRCYFRVPDVAECRVLRDLKHKRVAVARPRKRRRRIGAGRRVGRPRQRDRRDSVHDQKPCGTCVDLAQTVAGHDPPEIGVGRIRDAARRRVARPALGLAVDQRRKRVDPRNLENVRVGPAAPRKRRRRVVRLVRVHRRKYTHQRRCVHRQRPRVAPAAPQPVIPLAGAHPPVVGLRHQRRGIGERRRRQRVGAVYRRCERRVVVDLEMIGVSARHRRPRKRGLRFCRRQRRLGQHGRIGREADQKTARLAVRRRRDQIQTAGCGARHRDRHRFSAVEQPGGLRPDRACPKRRRQPRRIRQVSRAESVRVRRRNRQRERRARRPERRVGPQRKLRKRTAYHLNRPGAGISPGRRRDGRRSRHGDVRADGDRTRPERVRRRRRDRAGVQRKRRRPGETRRDPVPVVVRLHLQRERLARVNGVRRDHVQVVRPRVLLQKPDLIDVPGARFQRRAGKLHIEVVHPARVHGKMIQRHDRQTPRGRVDVHVIRIRLEQLQARRVLQRDPEIRGRLVAKVAAHPEGQMRVRAHVRVARGKRHQKSAAGGGRIGHLLRI